MRTSSEAGEEEKTESGGQGAEPADVQVVVLVKNELGASAVGAAAVDLGEVGGSLPSVTRRDVIEGIAP